MNETERMKRWRLILGAESSERFASMNGNEEPALSGEQDLMDQALAAIYNRSRFRKRSRKRAFQSADNPVAGRCTIPV